MLTPPSPSHIKGQDSKKVVPSLIIDTRKTGANKISIEASETTPYIPH